MMARAMAVRIALLVLAACTCGTLGARDGGNDKLMNVAGAVVRADGVMQRVQKKEKYPSKLAGVKGIGDGAFDVDPGKVASVFVTGLDSIMQAVGEFVKHDNSEDNKGALSKQEEEDNVHPSTKKGLSQICLGIWEMIKLVTPAVYHNSDEMVAVHAQLSAGVHHLPNLTGEVELFRSEGDVTALMRAIMSVLGQTVEVSPHPKVSTFIGCLGDMILGIGRGFELQTDGRADLGLQAVWQGLESCLGTMEPNTWQQDVRSIDAAIAMLGTRVLSYRRQSLLSKVCYKKAHIRPKKRPHVCKKGWKFDGEMYCMPQPSADSPCLEQCANEAGMCSAYCGEGKACCTASEAGADHKACEQATGFSDGFTHSQCVAPGPAVAFLIQDAGELLLRGYWLKMEDVNGRPSYLHSSHMKGVTMEMQWNKDQREWAIFKNRLDGTEVYYTSAFDTPTVPMSGWQAAVGAPPVPKIRTFPFPKDFNATEMSIPEPSLRAPMGEQIAECEPTYTRSQLWCWGECEEGYVKKLEWCEQVCSGTGFPASSHGVCGSTRHELMLASHGMHMMGENSVYNATEVAKELEQAGMDPEKLGATLDCFIDQGQQFARPFCPDGVKPSYLRETPGEQLSEGVHMTAKKNKVYVQVGKEHAGSSGSSGEGVESDSEADSEKVGEVVAESQATSEQKTQVAEEAPADPPFTNQKKGMILIKEQADAAPTKHLVMLGDGEAQRVEAIGAVASRDKEAVTETHAKKAKKHKKHKKAKKVEAKPAAEEDDDSEDDDDDK